ncbi:MAG: hypothetical protein LC114_07460 [Bryobacterales bacterium]|nr:hypothetical protein [Bryobacterales bacterium]
MAGVQQSRAAVGTSENDLAQKEADGLCGRLRDFIAKCRVPAVLEPGEAVQFLREGEYSLEPAGSTAAVFEMWSDRRVLRRRVVGFRTASAWKAEATVEKFGRKKGTLLLFDAEASAAVTVERGAVRSENLATLCRWCERLFPTWRIEHSSSAPDLENSLSPRFPRTMLRSGSQGIAALSAPDPESASDALAFGLIWLKHVQQRWPMATTRTLALFVPDGSAETMALRVQGLDSEAVQVRIFIASPDGFPREHTGTNCGNLDSAAPRLGNYLTANHNVRGIFEEVAATSEAEIVEDLQGGLHLELRGLSLAVCEGDQVRVGLSARTSKRELTPERLRSLVNRTARIRCGDSTQRQHTLYRLYPERWLEAMVRQNVEKIDPLIDPSTLRRQVSGRVGTDHSRTDLLALDRNGQLVILEIKVAEDPTLPIQALDYYSRLRVQLLRGEIDNGLLFPNRKIRDAPPRMLLIAPALQFHPTNETLLGYFESSIEVRQIGVALEWRKSLRVVFDHPRQRPNRGKGYEWQAAFSVRSGKPSPH